MSGCSVAREHGKLLDVEATIENVESSEARVVKEGWKCGRLAGVALLAPFLLAVAWAAATARGASSGTLADVQKAARLSMRSKAQEEDYWLKDPSDKYDTNFPCKDDEELFGNLCYGKCSTSFDGKYRVRCAGCTCAITAEHCPGKPQAQVDGRDYHTDCAAFDDSDSHAIPRGPIGGCAEHEERFMGFCFLKCSILTYGKFPNRVAMNTCNNGRAAGDWSSGLGPCNGFGVGGGISNTCPQMPMVY